ncbi:MAG TPA: protein kinase [Gemmatimonadaceae bacterium]|nr:protein kinase [Gemmatimonadaceae bacterium]
MSRADQHGPYRVTREIPPHLLEWQLPPGWHWGPEGLLGEHRHYQEVVDALGRSLSLVSVPNPEHATWLGAEARHLAHLNHPAMPTTYHYWGSYKDSRRGPGYLRRWIAGETVGARLARLGAEEIPYVLQVLRAAGSALSYLHDTGMPHGAVSTESVWVSPTGRLWLLNWQWTVPPEDIPPGITPDRRWMPAPAEWGESGWAPTTLSDQWQLAAAAFTMLTGEAPPARDVPPLSLVRPELPQRVADILDQALLAEPERRHRSVAALMRALDRGVSARPLMLLGDRTALDAPDSEEARLRFATGDDYDVLAPIGTGTFGSVWRVRDLTLEREVALKMLHPHVARDAAAVSRFRREARLAAQLAHPAIVPIYDWDTRNDVSWYTMELAEGGSVAELLARSGPRPLAEVAPQVEQLLDALVAAHAAGVVHRDLKPENILIDRYRRWRLTDFGIANVYGEEHAGSSGTPAFAAPEQLLGETQGPAVDCFALAAIVAFALSGRPPFGDRDAKRILARELAGEVDLEGFPVEITPWLRRGLAANPEERFQDSAAMLDAWRRAIAQALRRPREGRWWRRLLGRGAEGDGVPPIPARRPSREIRAIE